MKTVELNPGVFADVPDRAKWIAQDQDGWWFWYAREPARDAPVWNDIWWPYHLNYKLIYGSTHRRIKKTEVLGDWKKNLFELEPFENE